MNNQYSIPNQNINFTDSNRINNNPQLISNQLTTKYSINTIGCQIYQKDVI